MERWRNVWRDGFLPSLPTPGLVALREALRRDDHRLHQGATTTPLAHAAWANYPCEGACALGFCGWQGKSLTSVGEVEEFFNQACWEADQRLGEPAACRGFLNWFDDAPRSVMRRELLSEVERALALRLPPTQIRRTTLSSASAVGVAAV